MSENDFSGGTLTAPAPDNPLLTAAQAELKDIATNPENPRHAGYWRNDARVSAHIAQLYKKAVPSKAPLPETPTQSTPPAPAPGREPDQAPTMTPEDRVAQAEVETMLRQTFGEDYDREMAGMGH